ncbi:hypothetical protein VFPPC_14366 [Pochonia chlamydosporia 170]|uniref:Uncharacterized protein n=1 Tax=Pochonia chlamydosporia 170 TaxID=1380566 RepID=A0A179FNW8_METCM|nr:hypothetical protein VFPPC_14366 [Pochonia chlamydosporia 170]OAQ66699.1 hypothetical protein VFPPC_14366 [Pochonia chlamydosporia 170]
MPSLLSRLASASQSLGGEAKTPSRAFTICISSSDPLKLTTIYPTGAASHAPPLYSFTGSTSTKPNVVLYYGNPSHPNIIGQGYFSSSGSKCELHLRGMPITLRQSQMSGNYTLESPVTGRMKWKLSEMSGTSLYLHDAAGNVVAKLKSAHGDKVLEFYVPCDDIFAEAVVFSAATAKVINSTNNEAAAEVISSILTS